MKINWSRHWRMTSDGRHVTVKVNFPELRSITGHTFQLFVRQSELFRGQSENLYEKLYLSNEYGGTLIYDKERNINTPLRSESFSLKYKALKKDRINKCIKSLYEFVELGKDDEMGDLIYSFIFDLAERDMMLYVNFFLSKLDLDKLDTFAIITILSATNPFKDRVSRRVKFYYKAKKHLSKTEPDRVGSLLKGLK